MSAPEMSRVGVNLLERENLHIYEHHRDESHLVHVRRLVSSNTVTGTDQKLYAKPPTKEFAPLALFARNGV